MSKENAYNGNIRIHIEKLLRDIINSDNENRKNGLINILSCIFMHSAVIRAPFRIEHDNLNNIPLSMEQIIYSNMAAINTAILATKYDDKYWNMFDKLISVLNHNTLRTEEAFNDINDCLRTYESIEKKNKEDVEKIKNIIEEFVSIYRDQKLRYEAHTF